jgi:starvation-inducible DNA-binding protein
METLNTGLSAEARQASVDALVEHLANLEVLFAKTQGYHWNVRSPYFDMFHKMFEEQYDALAVMIDDTAERIRALGHRAPATLSAHIKHATLADDDSAEQVEDMVKQLLADYEHLISKLRSYEEIADDHDDEGTADFCVEGIRTLEKTAWMLRASV